jgi:hypothetical protein
MGLDVCIVKAGKLKQPINYGIGMKITHETVNFDDSKYGCCRYENEDRICDYKGETLKGAITECDGIFRPAQTEYFRSYIRELFGSESKYEIILNDMQEDEDLYFFLSY